RFPGSADLQQFWEHLKSNHDLVTEVPADRWDWRQYHGDPLASPGKTLSRWGGFITDIDKFDALYFNISPLEAELMDPQQRITLEAVYGALEDAGIAPGSLKGSNTGVFIGVASSDYAGMLRSSPAFSSQAQYATGSAHSVLVNRISYLLDIHGPSEPVDTACSSSLVAIHRAVEHIRNGDCDMAIAGGVNALLSPDLTLSFSQAGMLSAEGRCMTFDQRANGYVRGEGVGIIILKPLSRAVSDGDQIYGVIRGSAVNHGGKANTLTSPNPVAQRDLLLKAYRNAGIAADRVSYIEAHGTGTALGDPIEMDGLQQAFRELYAENNLVYPGQGDCRVGSVKSNIGHLEAAAGIAGVIKVLLSMKHGLLPGNPHLQRANEYIKLEGSIFRLSASPERWEDKSSLPLVAGVSSFGFGGANAHVVLEAYDRPGAVVHKTDVHPVIVVLSARNQERLFVLANNLLVYLEGAPDTDLRALGYTLQTGRDALEERLAMVVTDHSALQGLLRQYLSGETGDYFTGNTKKERTDFLLEGGAGRAYIDYALTHREHRSLARLWVRGIIPDWKQLYADNKPVKISLPGYPFARERYWMPAVGQASGIAGSLQQLHPLLHRNTSDLSEQRYTSVYTGKEPFFSDHKVAGEKVLPGVAYLELARVAGELATREKITAFRDVAWLKPIGISDSPREVHIRIHSGQGEIGYEIYTTNGMDRQVHGKGLLDRQAQSTSSLDIDTVRKRLPWSLDSAACYNMFLQLGLDYGREFRGIETLFYSDTEALSIISRPAAADYELAPGLMDSALQTCLGLILGQQEQQLALPFSVRKVLVYGALEERMYCYARRSEAGTAAYNLDLLTLDGEIRLSFNGLNLLPVKNVLPAKRMSVTNNPARRMTGVKQGTIQALITLCASVLKLKENDIEEDVEFAEYGMDSIIMMQLLNKLETNFHITIEPTAIINYPSVALLAKYLEEEKLPVRENISDSLDAKKLVELPGNNDREHQVGNTGKVAIIGMACRLPGSDNIHEYWENLKAGKELISEVPAGRWDAASVYAAAPTAGKAYVTKGGFMKNAGSFDARYFNISDDDALSMDPQQRIVLEMSRELLAHAGYEKEEIAGTNTSIYIGAKDNNYVRNNHHLLPEKAHQHIIVNNISNMIAARISDFYNLKGASQVVDTACSSSLVAIHQACDEIINGKCEMAIAGGISVMVDAFMHIGFSQAQVLSRDGRSYVFDERASGFVMGEGGGLLLLKDYSSALADGDQIFGIITGSHVNNDGKTIGVTVPDKEGQKAVIAAALARAGVSAADISCYEAHGTGTLLGDPIEIKAATEVYRESTTEKQYCALASVKSNIGHTMTAAGVAGVIKILLQMQHGYIVPTLHCENPHPRFMFSESPFYPNTNLKAWTNSRKIAAISSFGFGGTNCHAILEAPSSDLPAPVRKALPVDSVSNGFYWLGYKTEHLTPEASPANAFIHYDEPLMKNHLIGGKQVLMGMAYLSMCIDTGRHSFPGKALRINKLLFSNPLTLSKGQSAVIQRSYDISSGKISLSYDIAGEVSVCAEGELTTTVFEQTSTDIETLKAGSVAEVTGAAFYQHPMQQCYGQALRTVQECWRLPGGELLARLCINEELETDAYGLGIHPAIFDGAHVAAAICLYHSMDDAVKGHWPPLLLKSADIMERGASDIIRECYCHVSPVKGNAQVTTFNIKILQPDGTVIIKLTEFTTKSIPAQNTVQLSRKDMPLLVREYLGRKVGEILKIGPGKISLTKNFMDMGLDSSQMIGIAPVVERELGLELYPTTFFEYQNIEELSAYLEKEYSDKLQAYFVQATTEHPVTPVATTPVTESSRVAGDDALKDMAIIGMSGYLPQSSDLDAFWEHLKAGRDLVTEISPDHWDYRPWFDTDRNAVNKSYSKWGGMLKDLDKFDPLFFGISPLQAMWMDPQLRLLLQSAYHTFEDAGVINEIRNTRTGVFVGSCFHEYWDEIVRRGMPMQDYEHSSSAMSSLSGSVSYYFDLQGPSIPLDNACASSMTALHLACQAIRNNEADMALVAGLNVLLSPLHYVYFSRIQALSPSGRCYSFDKKADGYVPGEGVVSVLIKPLSKAIADGDTIHGVIKGSAINHVGKSNNPTSPRPELQTRLLEDAWEAAGIFPENISYIEAHGTGTSLGDPIEVNALKKAFRKYTAREQFCYLGSAKAHIGHLEGAAGLASIIKVLLMMKHRLIPRMPNFETLNPYIKLEGSPFRVNTGNERWQDEKLLLAGVSSFGMTGNNAHVVLEEYRAPVPVPYVSDRPAIVVLSARDKDRLREQVGNLKTYIINTPDINIHDLAYTLQVCREPMDARFSAVVADTDALLSLLTAYLDGKTGNFFSGHVFDSKASAANLIPAAIPNDHEYMSIAEQWVAGANINWKVLYDEDRPVRITLPVYPFAKERYWMPEPQGKDTTVKSMLHPLLHVAKQEILHPLLHMYNNGDNV
ncbi:beta-ketoacyl synthase N-terminal-like domain-containing protein, partial [Chitinophaga sp. 22308]|uniref:beta-ketoacyl synthase N-terminal-like domain-containing protein n=1 Tax=Chitinophaga sp. 22308 TaxID=3453906 RepID=UPI003F839466